jgi:anthranilate synthase component 2
MRLLIIDNYDSFTFNLVQYAEPFVEEFKVVRNDEIGIEEVADYDAIILSPGPGTTKDTGISLEVVRRYAKTKKILGVCMGMQVIAVAFGASLRNLDEPLHGVAVATSQTDIAHMIFDGVPQQFLSGRYHSWVIDENSLPKDLLITAVDTMGLIQAIKHKEYPLSGVQFHPESVLTEHGKLMIKNWIQS